jgi:hypothetical protein
VRLRYSLREWEIVVDKLTFIEKIVGSLAWPATILAVILFFRGPLGHLIRRVKRLKVKNIDVTLAEVEEKLLEAREDLPVIRELEIPTPEVKTLPESKIFHKTNVTLQLAQKKIERLSPPPVEVAEIEPLSDRAAKTPKQIIESAWQRVDSALRERAARQLIQPPKSLKSLLRSLELSATLPEEIFHSIRELEDARRKLKRRTKPIGHAIAASFACTADQVTLILLDELPLS